MYRIYYTNPIYPEIPKYQDVSELQPALQCCEYLRGVGMLYVVLVSDYQNMVGKPGVQAAGSECVPQLLN